MPKIELEPVIGLEIHAQMNTQTKMFCSCSNDSFGAKPNSNVCPVCMGFPGMLPAFNASALEKGVIAALALGCEIQEFSKFDRKNYFYPDSPKGFQISQYDQPVSKNGLIEVSVDGTKETIRINRLHLEDDAGKSVHVGDGTLCDFNRAGAPLMEIVSEPEIFSVAAANAYAQEIRRILRYVGASDCDMDKGMMRFDINISMRKKGDKGLGVKAEVKNLNSFRMLEAALNFEIARQTKLIENGERILQETRGWDDKKGETVSQRSKEEAHDYRYFPEPDLPPVVLSKAEIEKFKKLIPELPGKKFERFVAEYGLTDEDAGILTEDRGMAEYFEEVAKISGDAKKSVSFINTILLKNLREAGISLEACKITAVQLGKMIKMINDGVISNNMAKGEIFEAMFASGGDPEKIVAEKGLAQVSDTGELEKIVARVVEANPEPANDFRNGKEKAFGFLIGKIMKETGGQANPKMVNEILRKLLKV
jgi:aspartyl-tRNA(Asn)/glutamyl-tRNA(Gln) amidotransferase subunit B